MRIVLFGTDADELRGEFDKHADLVLVNDKPDVVVCYGGDGTLLAAEQHYAGVPKVPIRNSRRGHKCMAHPPEDIIERLAKGNLVETRLMKLECNVRYEHEPEDAWSLTALNEINAHMGHINSAVRLKMWINEEAYQNGEEILGDGFLVATPFGSTAYFKQITRGVFYRGIGVAFKHTTEHVNHVILPESSEVRIRITRGPAVLGHDNSPHYLNLRERHELFIKKHPEPATLLTWTAMSHPSDDF